MGRVEMGLWIRVNSVIQALNSNFIAARNYASLIQLVSPAGHPIWVIASPEEDVSWPIPALDKLLVDLLNTKPEDPVVENRKPVRDCTAMQRVNVSNRPSLQSALLFVFFSSSSSPSL